MGVIGPREFLAELSANIAANDLIKARLVLSHLGEMEEGTRERALFEILRAADTFSIPLIAELMATQPDLADSHPALKETLYSKVLDHPEVLLDLLRTGKGVWSRVYLAEVAGELRLQEAVPILVGLLTSDTEVDMLKAALYALGLIGDPRATAAVAEYLYSEDMDLIGTAVFALGQFATPTAVTRLAERIGADPGLDGLILDVLARIQTPESIEQLNQTLGSHHAHVRALGKLKLIEAGAKSYPVLVKNLRHNDPDLLIHTLNILGEIGDGAAIGPIRELLQSEPRDPNVRFAAYEALGRLPLEKRSYALAAGLQDPVANVRAAAAGAIDRNFSVALAAGIKNMIRAQSAEAHNLVLTIIDSQCDNIFQSLMDEEFFQDTALNYLIYKAHPDLRLHFARRLAEIGREDLARRLTGVEKEEKRPRLVVYAVDDSKLILKIYRGVLHNLGCEPHLFEFPVQALEQVKNKRPDVILTDLNMPEMTGLELTRHVRRWYGRSELPIIMVTTQNDLTDSEAAYQAGVNAILSKPFTEEDIGRTLAEFAGLK
ncbi:MAG: HEAT repeat domain-containing protein [Thermodesulfobacteriota bacterium]